jgi:hypothetical protein
MTSSGLRSIAVARQICVYRKVLAEKKKRSKRMGSPPKSVRFTDYSAAILPPGRFSLVCVRGFFRVVSWFDSGAWRREKLTTKKHENKTH